MSPLSPLAPGSPAGPGGPLSPVSPFSPGIPVKHRGEDEEGQTLQKACTSKSDKYYVLDRSASQKSKNRVCTLNNAPMTIYYYSTM